MIETKDHELHIGAAQALREEIYILIECRSMVKALNDFYKQLDDTETQLKNQITSLINNMEKIINSLFASEMNIGFLYFFMDKFYGIKIVDYFNNIPHSDKKSPHIHLQHFYTHTGYRKSADEVAFLGYNLRANAPFVNMAQVEKNLCGVKKEFKQQKKSFDSLMQYDSIKHIVQRQLVKSPLTVYRRNMRFVRSDAKQDDLCFSIEKKGKRKAKSKKKSCFRHEKIWSMRGHKRKVDAEQIQTGDDGAEHCLPSRRKLLKTTPSIVDAKQQSTPSFFSKQLGKWKKDKRKLEELGKKKRSAAIWRARNLATSRQEETKRISDQHTPMGIDDREHMATHPFSFGK